MNNENTKLFSNQLQEQIISNAAILEKAASLAVECAWQNLYRANQTLFKCIRANSDWDSKSVNTSCCLLLTNVQSDILNALLSTIDGFYRGPGVILRAVVENMACTIVIKSDPKKFEEFVQGKLEINKTIKPAKELFPEIGKYYGLLSNHFVHEGFDTIARSIKPVGQDVDFSLLPEISINDLSVVPLLSLAFLARFSGLLAEFCMAHLLKDFYYWRKNSENQLVEFTQNKEDQLINRLISEARISL
jgi:hypothetical protein